jgi:hypothetical protein
VRLYMICASYLVFGGNYRLSVARCQGAEPNKEGRCR